MQTMKNYFKLKRMSEKTQISELRGNYRKNRSQSIFKSSKGVIWRNRSRYIK